MAPLDCRVSRAEPAGAAESAELRTVHCLTPLCLTLSSSALRNHAADEARPARTGQSGAA